MAIRQISSFENWMSPDEYKGWDGYFYYWEGINIRKRSKQIFLNNSISVPTQLNTRVNWYVTAILAESSAYQLNSVYDWYVYNLSWVEVFKDSWSRNYVNMLKVNSWWTDYWVILTDTTLHIRTYDSSDIQLWIIWSWIVTTPDFSSSTWWTISAPWTWRTITWGYAQHTAGNTQTLTNSSAISNTTRYRLYVYIYNRTAWSVTVTFWWVSSWVLSSNGEFYIWWTTSSTASLTITPTSDFDWKIDYIELQPSNVTQAYGWITLNSSQYKPFYILDNTFLFIWCWNIVTRIDLTSRVDTDVLTLKSNEVIRAITRIWESFIIYTNDWSEGYQYFRDWFSTNPDRRIQWYWLPIINVANMWNYDYVICYKIWVSFLYKSMWYDRQLMYKSNYLNVENKNYKRFQFYPDTTNAIETVNNLVYFPDYLDTKYSQANIYSIGSYLPWQLDWLNNEYTITGTLTKITALLYENSWYNLKIWYRLYSAPNYYNYVTSVYIPETNNSYWSTGFVETIKFHWDDYSKIKRLEKIRFGYYLPNSNRNIKVYTSIDWWAYSLKKTITDTTLKYVTIEWYDIAINFHELQIKFEINHTTGNSDTAYISLPITIWYNDDEKN